MSHGTDRSGDARKIELTSVANPRRTQVDAEGRPEPVPAPQHASQD